MKNKKNYYKIERNNVMAKGLLKSRLSNSNDNNKIREKKKKPLKYNRKKNKEIISKKLNTKPLAEENEDYDNQLEKHYTANLTKEIAKEKHKNLVNNFKKIGILLVCLYLVFLIYGIFITEYIYDENGNSVPLEMSFSDMKKLDEFKLLVEKYDEMKELYKKVLEFDVKVLKNTDNAMIYSTDYEGLLEDVAKLSIQTDAISVATEYAQIKSMVLTWIKTDIAVYLQNMSAAISENSIQKLSNATEDRTRMKNDFIVISQNLVAIGNKVKGFDTSDISEWSVDEYISSLQN